MNRGTRGRRLGRRLIRLLVAAAALVTIAAVAASAGAAEQRGFARLGTPTEGLGLHYWETGFGSIGARADGGLVAEREDQAESFLSNGTADPAAPPWQLPEFSSWFPLASGKSLVLEESKLTRLNPDGSVDTSFGTAGTIEAPAETAAAAELPSGQILLAGTATGGTHTTFSWVTVELIGADGSADQSRGEAGATRLSLPGEGGGVYEIAPTPDGGALVIGGDFLLKLRADGRPNPAFGSGGLVIHGELELVGGRVLADGSVEVVGSGPGSSGKDLVYLRFTAAGKPDPAFGSEGFRLFDLGGEEEAHAASWGTDGSVIVAGSAQPAGSCFHAVGCQEVPILAAFDPAGNLESAFGSGGVLRLEALRGRSEDLTGNGVGSLTRRPDGSIIAAGTSPPLETTAFLAAVSPQGALLSGFGEAGIVRERRSTPAEQTIAGITPLAGGGLLAAGISDVGVENTPVLIRYAGDGGLDPSFGEGGYAVLGKARSMNGFAVDGSGHLLTTLYGYPHARLVELRSADGERESAFGTGGLVQLPYRIFAEAVGFAADGGAIVIGSRDVGGPAEPGVVLRYRSNGKPDRGFGGDGRVDLQAPGGGEVRVRALATAPGGRTLLAGFSHHSFALGQLLPDGRPDPRFGSGGWALTATGAQPLVSRGGATRAVALRRAGSRIYLAGVTREGKRLHLVLLHFGADGRLDRRFGRGGRRTASIPKAAEPKTIVPTRHGVLVVLAGGPRPLVTFGRDGKVRRQPAGRGRDVSNVRAAVSGGRLILGWNARSKDSWSDTYYLGARSLGGG